MANGGLNGIGGIDDLPDHQEIGEEGFDAESFGKSSDDGGVWTLASPTLRIRRPLFNWEYDDSSPLPYAHSGVSARVY